ncbi:hypothetical protein, partial [Acinetobacter baumannii]
VGVDDFLVVLFFAEFFFVVMGLVVVVVCVVFGFCVVGFFGVCGCGFLFGGFVVLFRVLGSRFFVWLLFGFVGWGVVFA